MMNSVTERRTRCTMPKKQSLRTEDRAFFAGQQSMAWSLFDQAGERKYLSPMERRRFRDAAKSFPPDIETFCLALLDTGCRISEALALTARSVDFGNNVIVLESLKKRRRGIYRSVPALPAFLERLDEVHGLRLREDQSRSTRLWPWHRMTGYRRVTKVMQAAGIKGPQATPKGLRHGFAIAALESGVPLNLVQRWLGHSDMATTAIYANALGAEEQYFARKMWEIG